MEMFIDLVSVQNTYKANGYPTGIHRVNITMVYMITLLHQRPDVVPETVEQREGVLDDGGGGGRAAVGRRAPLVRAETGDDEERGADGDVGDDDVDPDLEGERRKEGKDGRLLRRRTLEEDADAEVHERLGEVDDLLAHVADRQRRYGEIGFLRTRLIRTQVKLGFGLTQTRLLITSGRSANVSSQIQTKKLQCIR